MIEKIEPLVKNFVSIARERIIAVFLFSFVLIHLKLVPKTAIAFVGVLLIIHGVQMYFVNIAFQSLIEGKQKHDKIIDALNLGSLIFSVLFCATLLFMAFV
jgi:hypothetical protein